jgi:hypothetical protein
MILAKVEHRDFYSTDDQLACNLVKTTWALFCQVSVFQFLVSCLMISCSIRYATDFNDLGKEMASDSDFLGFNDSDFKVDHENALGGSGKPAARDPNFSVDVSNVRPLPADYSGTEADDVQRLFGPAPTLDSDTDPQRSELTSALQKSAATLGTIEKNLEQSFATLKKPQPETNHAPLRRPPQLHLGRDHRPAESVPLNDYGGYQPDNQSQTNVFDGRPSREAPRSSDARGYEAHSQPESSRQPQTAEYRHSPNHSQDNYSSGEDYGDFENDGEVQDEIDPWLDADTVNAIPSQAGPDVVLPVSCVQNEDSGCLQACDVPNLKTFRPFSDVTFHLT